ncbi:MAG: HEAT repeat domain-containing protein, partial [Desulfuromonadales bacterium]|nr:HEAT repeat domain-containing protein [Desulfuromonadales bacterium]
MNNVFQRAISVFAIGLLTGILLLSGCSRDTAVNLSDLAARAKTGERTAIVKLVDLLAAAEGKVAETAYPAVVAAGTEAIPVLIDKIGTADRQQREYVIAALGTLKAAQAVLPISRVLADRTLERRYVAAWALGEIAVPDGIPPLIGALDDPNQEVRRYATRALIKVNRPAVGPLLEHLRKASGEGAAGAIRALGDIADPVALEVLLAQSAGAHRAEAFLALGKLRDPRAEAVLIKGLGDDDWQARMNAAMAIGPLGGPAAAAALKRTVDDEVHVVREWSARSLEMVTGQPVLYRNAKGEMVRP